MDIMLLGDSHGDDNFIRGALIWAQAHGIERVLQVGDFGYWPKFDSGQRFLKACGEISIETGVDLYFLDGNHEDHDELNALQARHPGSNFMRASKRQGAPIFIRRGATWEWEGTRFGAFGGAYSVDRGARTKFHSWFPQEMPDRSKIAELGKVDVLLTHDSPVVPEPYLISGQFVRNEESAKSQEAVYDALMSSQPDLLIHGHWHVSWRGQVHGATVLGLDCNYASLYASAAILDVENKTLYGIGQWEYAHE